MKRSNLSITPGAIVGFEWWKETTTLKGLNLYDNGF
jgi:hypothetical protein